MLRHRTLYQQAVRTVHGGLQQGLSLSQSLGLLTPNSPLHAAHVALDRGVPLHDALVLPSGIPALDTPIADPIRYLQQLDQHMTHMISTVQQFVRRLVYPSVLMVGLVINAIILHTVVIPTVSQAGNPSAAWTLYRQWSASLMAHRWDVLLVVGLIGSFAWPWLHRGAHRLWHWINRDWYTATALTGVSMRLAQGIPIHTSMHHAGITPDPHIPISQTLAHAFDLTPELTYLLAIGETTGDWDRQLAHAIDTLTHRHTTTVQRCLATLPALLLILIGGYLLVFFSVLFQPLSQSIYNL
ncbi:MAG: hypothetical protein CMJ93_07160 [Planctomycetes bacterium]|nr:hypothetical protein [Planctomycetota bacterium]